MSNSSERLESVLGFDPAKPQGVTGDLLKEVVGEIQKERLAKAKVAAKEQIVKAMELRERMYKSKKEFDNQFAKFEKELGKMMNKLESSLNGGRVETQEPQEDQETSE